MVLRVKLYKANWFSRSQLHDENRIILYSVSYRLSHLVTTLLAKFSLFACTTIVWMIWILWPCLLMRQTALTTQLPEAFSAWEQDGNFLRRWGSMYRWSKTLNSTRLVLALCSRRMSHWCLLFFFFFFKNMGKKIRHCSYQWLFPLLLNL